MKKERCHSAPDVQLNPLGGMKQFFGQVVEAVPKDFKSSLAILEIGSLGLGGALGGALAISSEDNNLKANGINKFTPKYQCMDRANGKADGEDYNAEVFTYTDRGEDKLRDGQKVVTVYVHDGEVATWANKSCEPDGSRTVSAQAGVDNNEDGKLEPASDKEIVIKDSNAKIFPTQVKFKLHEAYRCLRDKVVIKGHRRKKLKRDREIGAIVRETGRYDGWRRLVKTIYSSSRIGLKRC